MSLLAHGGIAMCGGRDFDRILLDNVVKPWLLENFDLPEISPPTSATPPCAIWATWAAEKAKIDLSSSDEAVVTLDDSELRVRDEAGVSISTWTSP